MGGVRQTISLATNHINARHSHNAWTGQWSSVQTNLLFDVLTSVKETYAVYGSNPG